MTQSIWLSAQSARRTGDPRWKSEESTAATAVGGAELPWVETPGDVFADYEVRDTKARSECKRLPPDPYGCGVTSAAAAEWRAAWDNKQLREGSIDPDATEREPRLRPQAMTPRTSMSPNQGLRHLRWPPVADDGDGLPSKPGRADGKGKARARARTVPAGRTVRPGWRMLREARPPPAESTPGEAAAEAAPTARAKVHTKAHAKAHAEASAGADRPDTASSKVSLAESLAESLNDNFELPAGWRGPARKGKAKRRAPKKKHLDPSPSKLAVYLAQAHGRPEFLQQRLSGKNQMAPPGGWRNQNTVRVVTVEPETAEGDPVIFDKVLDMTYPKVPQWWSDVDETNLPQFTMKRGPIKGKKPRWIGMPSQRLHVPEPIEVFPEVPSPEPPAGYKWQWLSNWTVDDLTELMADQVDQSPYVRERGMRLTYGTLDIARLDRIPAAAIEVVCNRGLTDHIFMVRFAAAVTVATLGIPSELATEIIFEVLESGEAEARWQAAKCLASVGACTTLIVRTLLEQLSTGSTNSRKTQANDLLIALSKASDMPRVYTLELLNSMDNKYRIAAIRLIRCLHGPMAKDCTDKLLSMMWEDWDINNRLAAAEALGLSGSGQVIHDDLVARLNDNNGRIRSDAILKLAEIQRITPSLIPAFVARFYDSKVAVRLDACRTAAVLQPVNEELMGALASVAEGDKSIQVRCCALDAIGDAGHTTESGTEKLAWIIKYCKDDAVAVHAMRAVAKMGTTHPEVIKGLVARTKEADVDPVRAEARRALQTLERLPENKVDANEKKIKGALVGMCSRTYTRDHIFKTERGARQAGEIQRLSDRLRRSAKLGGMRPHTR